MSKNTKEKYYNFMMSMYNAQEFDIRKLMKEHKVSTRIATLLRERRVIAKYGKLTRWVGDMPTQAMANAYAKESLRVARISKMQNSIAPTQLTIKPIRKAPVDTPQPIVKEPEYDNSNSKMLLIMAAGAILGFLIATIIWK
jgi:hypothetical protein